MVSTMGMICILALILLAVMLFSLRKAICPKCGRRKFDDMPKRKLYASSSSQEVYTLVKKCGGCDYAETQYQTVTKDRYSDQPPEIKS